MYQDTTISVHDDRFFTKITSTIVHFVQPQLYGFIKTTSQNTLPLVRFEKIGDFPNFLRVGRYATSLTALHMLLATLRLCNFLRCTYPEFPQRQRPPAITSRQAMSPLRCPIPARPVIRRMSGARSSASLPRSGLAGILRWRKLRVIYLRNLRHVKNLFYAA